MLERKIGDQVQLPPDGHVAAARLAYLVITDASRKDCQQRIQDILSRLHLQVTPHTTGTRTARPHPLGGDTLPAPPSAPVPRRKALPLTADHLRPDPTGDPWREFHVSPRYLAGPGDGAADHGMQAMLDAEWPRHNDDLANFYISSPCQRIRLGFLPEGEDNGLWKISVAAYPFSAPRWAAVFDDCAPVEVVAAFTSALVADYTTGRENYLYGAPNRPGFTTLLDAGWTREQHREATTIKSPDSLAGIVHRRWPDPTELRGGVETWTLWGGLEKSWDRWYATFTSAAPEHLVAVTAAAMADPSPVVRTAMHIPRRHLPYLRTSPVPPPIPTPLDVRRALAARARISVPSTARSASRIPPPADSSRSPSGPRR